MCPVEQFQSQILEKYLRNFQPFRIIDEVFVAISNFFSRFSRLKYISRGSNEGKSYCKKRKIFLFSRLSEYFLLERKVPQSWQNWYLLIFGKFWGKKSEKLHKVSNFSGFWVEKIEILVERFHSGLLQLQLARPEKYLEKEWFSLSKKVFGYRLWSFGNFFVVLQNSLVRCIKIPSYV